MAKTSKEKTYKGTKRDQYTIVLENLQSDFRVFGEGLQSVQHDISDLKRKVDIIDSNVYVLKNDVAVLKSDMSDVKKLLHTHDDTLLDHEDRITVLEQ